MSHDSDHCFWHGVEPVPPNAFRVCGECWHAWPTVEAFEADCAQLARDMGWPIVDPDPPFCPLCSHDW